MSSSQGPSPQDRKTARFYRTHGRGDRNSGWNPGNNARPPIGEDKKDPAVQAAFFKAHGCHSTKTRACNFKIFEGKTSEAERAKIYDFYARRAYRIASDKTTQWCLKHYDEFCAQKINQKTALAEYNGRLTQRDLNVSGIPFEQDDGQKHCGRTPKMFLRGDLEKVAIKKAVDKERKASARAGVFNRRVAPVVAPARAAAPSPPVRGLLTPPASPGAGPSTVIISPNTRRVKLGDSSGPVAFDLPGGTFSWSPNKRQRT